VGALPEMQLIGPLSRSKLAANKTFDHSKTVITSSLNPSDYAQNSTQATSSYDIKANQEVAIAIHGLDMVFSSKNQHFQALKAVDLTVPKGVIQLVLGPGGAGKTTLLSVVAGLLTPTAGQVILLGEEMTKMSKQRQARFRLSNVGIVFQENNLLRSLTALENIEIALNLRGVRGRAARQQARQLLKAVRLGDKLNQLPRQLSGGQQQRVAVARALAGSPRLLIADEPTASLDSENGHIVVELFRNLVKGNDCTVLMATHDYRLIQYADRIVHLEDGILT
jgi:putative ABC transport system ATP-binding protein